MGASSRNERIVLLRLIVASYVNKKGFLSNSCNIDVIQ